MWNLIRCVTLSTRMDMVRSLSSSSKVSGTFAERSYAKDARSTRRQESRQTPASSHEEDAEEAPADLRQARGDKDERTVELGFQDENHIPDEVNRRLEKETIEILKKIHQGPRGIGS